MLQEETMLKHSNRLWIAVILLGWAFDFLFWGHTPGINFAIYVIVVLTTGVLLLSSEGFRPAAWSMALLAPILFFAVMFFMRTEPLSVFLSVILPLLLMAVFTVTFLGGRWIFYALADYVVRAFQLIGSVIIAGAAFAFNKPSPPPGTEAATKEAEDKSASRHVWPVVRGILIAIPIIAVFAALLSAADLVFAQRVNSLIQLFSLEKLPEYILRGVYIVILAYFLAGILLHAVQKSHDETLYGVEKPLVPQFLGFTEAAIILGSVIALFAFFVIIQFQYFFGGQANINIEGYTYAEYARRGFGELVLVAFFSLLLFQGLSTVVKRNTPAQRKGFAALGVGLVALVFVMLLSAYYRLTLYEEAYGFSRLRTYTHVFIIWLALLLLAVVVLDLLQRQRTFALAALLALIGFSTSLVLMNVDAFIADHNVQRAVEGHELDVAYLASLSPDAVPTLAGWYNDPALAPSLEDAVGASLACLKAQPTRRDTDWRSFNFSVSRADQVMASLDLSGYKIIEDQYPPKIVTPQGLEYECTASVD
jgi:hypothetical protein